MALTARHTRAAVRARRAAAGSRSDPGQEQSGGANLFRELARHIGRGSVAVFLSPAVFRSGKDPLGWLLLPKKGALVRHRNWLFVKDEWAKRRPIFEGLPAGSVIDYTYYRDMILDEMFSGQKPVGEVVAAAIDTSLGYTSGTLASVHRLGAGRFVLNTLRVRENLGRDPAAERLLRNMLRYAARDLDKPLADLPPDFDATLVALGLKPRQGARR